MHDLALLGFLAALIGMGFRRPFLFVLAYVYVDVVSPQRLSYYLLNSVPVSLICFSLAVLGWLAADDKSQLRFGFRQLLLIALLVYTGSTTLGADFPIEAASKFGWVWKALVFATFLPVTLRTRLRIEGLALIMILSASSIIVVGGIKTLYSGGGYGSLNLMVDNNSGLYEGSIISAVAVAIVPLILYLARYGTIFPPDRRVRLYAAALTFACLLIPVGTQARTGLICIGLLAALMLRVIKRRALYLACLAAVGLAAVPLLPKSYTQRMQTIEGYQGDVSASTRLAMWGWTLDYVKTHPFGGGFEDYLGSEIHFETFKSDKAAANDVAVTAATTNDKGRAFHSSYFEMLGEQGWPGLGLWLLLHGLGLVRMEVVRRRWRRAEGEDAWIAPLATALQHAHLIYLTGGLFVGIAFQPFVYMLVGLEIGFDQYLRQRARPAIAAPPMRTMAARAA